MATIGELSVELNNLNFEVMPRRIINAHARAILKVFRFQLQHGLTHNVFSSEGKVILDSHGGYHVLRVHLCADKVVLVSVDVRTGCTHLRDTGDLPAMSRRPRFAIVSDRLNDNPTMLLEVLTIMDLIEQKANYLRLQAFWHCNFSKEDKKVGTLARRTMNIKLANFPSHYLVLVIIEEDIRHALISVKVLSDSMYGNMIMEDIRQLDAQRIREWDKSGSAMLVHRHRTPYEGMTTSIWRHKHFENSMLIVDNARVTYTKVEAQFKLCGIPYMHISPTSALSQSSTFSHIQSSLASSIPALCVQSSDILSGAPAAEAVMANICVMPLN
ncbi:hypothetical protein JVU11DRAFT_10645 [Chiua virens]|nr:hypothetical protein JVU11DRAFT_10645 [Chiua virens]